jgi:hypothetical protein
LFTLQFCSLFVAGTQDILKLIDVISKNSLR